MKNDLQLDEERICVIENPYDVMEIEKSASGEIEGNIDKNEISKIKGVVKIDENKGIYTISIEDKSVVEDVWKYITKTKNITKFVVEEPTLNEIFIEKVGESYEK